MKKHDIDDDEFNACAVCFYDIMKPEGQETEEKNMRNRWMIALLLAALTVFTLAAAGCAEGLHSGDVQGEPCMHEVDDAADFLVDESANCVTEGKLYKVCKKCKKERLYIEDTRKNPDKHAGLAVRRERQRREACGPSFPD